MKFQSLLFLALCATILQAEPEEFAPIFRAYFNKSAMVALIPAAPSIRRSKIAEDLGGKLLSGMAYTDAKTHVELVPSKTDARLQLVMDFNTVARTTTETRPRPDILVDVYVTAITQTHVTKTLVFKPDHIELLPAEATSKTAMTVHGASARATGAFAGEKKRQAEEQAMQIARGSLSSKEEETQERVNGEILGKVEKQSGDMIQELNRDYKTIFYDPIFTDNRVPGRPHFYTFKDGFRVAIDPPAGPWEKMAPLPKLSPNTIVGMNIHQSLVNKKLSNRLAGKVYDEYELEALLIREGLIGQPHEWGGVPDRTYVRMCDTDPLKLTFANNEVQVVMCVQGVKIADGPWEGGANLSMTYVAQKPDGAVLPLERGDVVALPLQNKPISDAALKRFDNRYSLIFPPTQTVESLPIPTSSTILQDMRLHKASIENGWLTVEWEPGPDYQD